MPTDDGGPAFPTSYYETEHGDRIWATGGLPGMSLRDWFAGQCWGVCLLDADSYGEAAQRAYEAADAMLTQRKAK